ncbi:tRNA uracil 4-sulfurtransferase ThiI [Aeromonas salmonicida]|uniref:tRNA uracil 4-sulfurtransferase ThiI n=1 Tax=Aeromonas salmonicida TaxID=645 RepID=UPI0038BB0BA0
MKFIIKLFPEITIKSKSVRQRFTKMLQGNIRNVLRRFDEDARVRMDWDKLVVSSRNDQFHAQYLETLACIPGIQYFLEVKLSNFTDLHDIFEQTRAVWGDRLKGKTFCVRARRVGKHDFSSLELERYVGGGLNQHCETAGVRLKKPDIQVNLEVENDELYIISAVHHGMGGFPMATQEDVLSLLSGGFDSGVASYQFIKRGCRVHYCFFNLGGAAHEIGVKQVAYYLWSKFGASHKVRFTAIDFEPVVAEILEKVDNGQMGVVLKRMMMRAAGQVADYFQIPALVTGECVGQVSSQTLTNLNVIDRVTDKVILRPLITWDKPDIISEARRIGTLEFAEIMPEYCGVISKKPTIKAVLSNIEAEEANFDFAILDKVVSEARYLDIRRIGEETAAEVQEIETTEVLAADEVILDIRSADERDEKPLVVEGRDVLHIPFFKLATAFGDLPKEQTYLLYCDRGVMSKLQALYLKEKGFDNVKVYRP